MKEDSARRVLARASAAPFDAWSSQLVAAAAAIAGEPAIGPPGLAFVTLAALGNSEALEQVSHLIPSDECAAVLQTAEPFLGIIDPVWAWRLEIELLGEPESMRWPGLGLSLAGRMSEAAARQLFEQKLATNMLFAGEFEAHANARARTIRDAPPQDSQVDVAAAALQDPEHALRLATSMLEVTMPWEVTEALTLVAAAALRAGVGERIRARVQDSSFASEQAAWLQAAVLSGAMLPDEAVELASALAPAISEGLEANREPFEEIPLLVALDRRRRLHAGRLTGAGMARTVPSSRRGALRCRSMSGRPGPGRVRCAQT